jgi:hypothetical protein
MKQVLYYSTVIALLSVLTVSCSRKDPDAEPEQVAGKGGNATLLVTPQHHGKNIDSCMIYIKYNTQDLPATSYDDSAWCVKQGDKPVATFNNLKKGNYYLFGRGWDPNIAQRVQGGGPYKIVNETSQSYTVAVTEEH